MGPTWQSLIVRNSPIIFEIVHSTEGEEDRLAGGQMNIVKCQIFVQNKNCTCTLWIINVFILPERKLLLRSKYSRGLEFTKKLLLTVLSSYFRCRCFLRTSPAKVLLNSSLFSHTLTLFSTHVIAL